MKILFVVNEARFFVSHRLPLGLEAQRRGYEVVVVAAPETGEELLAAHDIRFVSVGMSRSGFNVWQEMKTFRDLRRLYRLEQPDLVHHVTIKPVIYGSFAARHARVDAIVNAVPGMGFVFTRRGVVAAVRRAVVNALYRAAFAVDHMRVIFQNSEDMRAFIGHAIVDKDQSVLIRGSGVDLTAFQPDAVGPENMTFLMVSRMLRDKGVHEFVRAGSSVRETHPEWRFVLAGDVDPGNPSSLTEAELKELERQYGVQWLGHCDRIPELMAQCHVVCLPSYREGLPKTLLEGAAAGRGLIASNIAGCREVITHEVTGLLVTSRSVPALAEAMLRLGEDDELRERCAESALQKARAVFSITDVVEHHFRVYQELVGEAGLGATL